MEHFTRTYPDGTRGRYWCAPGSTLPLTLAMLKPPKRPSWARTAKRQFPVYAAGITSSRDYIRVYFGLNSLVKFAAYPRSETNWLNLYHPLHDAPAATYAGVDSVETIADEAGA